MAKKITENVKVEDELTLEAEKIETENAEALDETAASDTLHPGSMPVGPANKSAAIGKIVNAFAGMSPEAINKFWEMINSVGHEADSRPDNSAEYRASVSMKPSDASTANLGANDALVRKEDFDLDVKAVISEDLSTLFEGEDLSDETKEKFAVLFEAAVNLKSSRRIAELEEEFEAALDEEADEMANNLAEAINTYLDHATGEWLNENAVAIESTLSRGIVDEFLEDIRAVFEKHYVEVPEDKVDIVAEMSDRIEELEKLASAQIEEMEEIKAQRDELINALDEAEIEGEFEAVAEGLTETEVEKLKTLSEGIEFKDVDDFRKKVTIIRESHFKKAETGLPINKAGVLFEEVEDIVEDTSKTVAGPMAKYVSAIAHSARK